jgi:hypothetical protein
MPEAIFLRIFYTATGRSQMDRLSKLSRLLTMTKKLAEPL